MSVEFKGKEYSVKKKGRGESSRISLNLSGKEITNISEIKGLETLTDLHVLKLNNNNILEIKGLETLNNLIQLDLRDNQIAEIKGLDNLVNLEELSLEHNKIEIIKGLDTLKNLHTLNLFRNKITQVESFQNKEKLSSFLLSENPLYDQVKYMFGSTSPQALVKFSQLSENEKHNSVLLTKEDNLKKQRMARERTIELEKEQTLNVRVIFGILGSILLLIGILMITPIFNNIWPSPTFSITIGLTFVVIGTIMFIGGLTKGHCLVCCS